MGIESKMPPEDLEALKEIAVVLREAGVAGSVNDVPTSLGVNQTQNQISQGKS